MKQILDSFGSSSSKRKEKKKTETLFFSYCKMGPHDQSHCFKKKFYGYEKQIVNLQALLQKSTITSPSSSTSQGSALQSSTSSTQDLGQGHALQASLSSPSQVPWILDLGASHHMTSSQGVFSTLEASPIPHILMGNNTTLLVCGKGLVCIQDGTFNDVLYVPSLSTNLLSISQITCSGSGKIVEFTANLVFIQDSAT